MTLSEMLDLPREERSKLLRAIPLTREYVFGCLDGCFIQHIHRVITRCGGVWRDEYCHPGLAVVATFRTSAGMRACTLDLIHWQNCQTRENYTVGLPGEDEIIESLMLDETFARTSVVPALCFEEVSFLGPEVRRSRPLHPIYVGR